MSETDTAVEQQAERKLYGAAAIAAERAAKRQQTANLDSFLKTVTEGYEAAKAEAVANVEAARNALREAEEQLAKVELYNPDRPPPPAFSLMAPQSRQVRQGSGNRAGRGEWPSRILEALSDEPDGLPRADLIQRLGQKGNKSGEASISNALVNMKKKGELGYSNGFYSKPV